MPDAAMEVLPPSIQLFQTGNVKASHYPETIRSLAIEGID